MVIRERFYTADDLWALSHLPEHDGKRFELSEGRLIEMPLNGFLHGVIAGMAGGHIGNWIHHHNLGKATAAGTGYILCTQPDTVRAPDVGFISAARVPEGGLPDGYIPFAPDLAVEVVSPNDEAEEIHQKVQEYLRYGTRLVWVFYPKSRSVAAHTPTGSHTVDMDGTLDGGDVLPGFSVKVSAVFG